MSANNNNNGNAMTRAQIKEAKQMLQAECEFCGDSIRETELYICEYDDCPKDRQMFCEAHMIACHKSKKIDHGGKSSLHHITRVRAQNVAEFEGRVQQKALVLASLAQKSDATVLWQEYMAGRIEWGVAILGIVESYAGKNTTVFATSFALGASGALAGAKLGALVGTAAGGPVGTVVGGVVGWILGTALAMYASQKLVDASLKVPVEPTHSDLIDMVRDAVVFFHFLLDQITDPQVFNEKKIKKQFRKLALEYHPDKQRNHHQGLYIALQGHYGVLLAVFDSTSPIETNPSKQGFQALKKRINRQQNQ